jgi:hypothetical protein
LLHPGSRIWIPDPGGKKAPDPGSGSATLVKGLEFQKWSNPVSFEIFLPALCNLIKVKIAAVIVS